MGEIIETTIYSAHNPDFEEIKEIIKKYVSGDLRVEIDGNYVGSVISLKIDYNYPLIGGKEYQLIAVCRFS